MYIKGCGMADGRHCLIMASGYVVWFLVLPWQPWDVDVHVGMHEPEVP